MIPGEEKLTEILRAVFIDEAGLLIDRSIKLLDQFAGENSDPAQIRAVMRVLHSTADSASELDLQCLADCCSAVWEYLETLHLFPDEFNRSVAMRIKECLVLAHGHLQQSIECRNHNVPCDLERGLQSIRRETIDLKSRAFKDGEGIPFTGRLRIDMNAHSVAREHEARLLLTNNEMSIMGVFDRAQARLVSREDLLQQVWGGAKVSAKNFGVHISNLRRKLKSIHLGLRWIPPDHYQLVQIDGQSVPDRKP